MTSPRLERRPALHEPALRLSQNLRPVTPPLNAHATWVTRAVGCRDVTYLKYTIDNPRGRRGGENIQEIFSKIHEDKAEELLQKPSDCKENDAPMGRCVYVFDAFRECSCPPLDRKKSRERQVYEDNVIKQALQYTRECKQLNVTVFASGYLFGEFVLFTKLIHRLQNEAWSGKITVNFIDHSYAPGDPLSRDKLYQSIEKVQGKVAELEWTCDEDPHSYQDMQDNKELLEILEKTRVQEKVKRTDSALATQHKIYENTTSHAQAITAFVKYIRFALPETIKLKARFFSEGNDYRDLCFIKEKFYNHLIIGCDIDDNEKTFHDLRNVTQYENGLHAVLLKKARYTGDKIGAGKIYASA